jgi:hypothetical protein
MNRIRLIIFLFLCSGFLGLSAAGEVSSGTSPDPTEKATPSLPGVDFTFVKTRHDERGNTFQLTMFLVFEPDRCLGFRCTRVGDPASSDEAEINSARLYRVLQGGALQEVKMPHISVRSDESFEVSCPKAYTRLLGTLLMWVSVQDLIQEMPAEGSASFVVGLDLYRFGEKAEKYVELRSSPFFMRVEGNRIRASQHPFAASGKSVPNAKK